LARRYALYYTATAVSGAFSGLLAGLIVKYLNPRHGLEGWRWLLIIEGVGSCGVGLFAWSTSLSHIGSKTLMSRACAVFLPDWPATTKWLTDEERLIMQQRLAADNLGSTQDEGEHTQTHLQAIGSCFKEWRVLALSLLYMLATGSQTIQYFIPALVGQLGYTGFYLQVGFRSIP
jgi:hypothetical protein